MVPGGCESKSEEKIPDYAKMTGSAVVPSENQVTYREYKTQLPINKPGSLFIGTHLDLSPLLHIKSSSQSLPV